MATDPKGPPVADAEDSLEDFPYYEPGKVPQYQRYHAEVSYLDPTAFRSLRPGSESFA